MQEEDELALEDLKAMGEWVEKIWEAVEKLVPEE